MKSAKEWAKDLEQWGVINTVEETGRWTIELIEKAQREALEEAAKIVEDDEYWLDRSTAANDIRRLIRG
jgi:hypothetical protein